ncbi:MAG: DUF1501 domain-containing protein [Planctomycetales bacterium]|nr:DUF1501 domain-containing protein [Planctomycetales bacterium]
MNFRTPAGMNRRHFMKHMAGAAALAGPAMSLTNSFQAHADTLKRNHKSAIMLWMGGGPPTIDIWDLKPGANTGGPFKPISTSGDMQICEHLPLMAKQMHHMSIVRSMSTREADHTRGRYYMHTGYVPNPNVEHPSYGAVIAHEMAHKVPELEIPPFIAVGGGSVGPGFLGMSYAPFVVSSNGQVRNLQMNVDNERLAQRMYALASLEKGFIAQNRGPSASDHAKILDKTRSLMTSEQMKAFKVNQEPEEIREAYGATNFGRGCLMARRLVEVGVPFVEVDLGGWDMHNGVHASLETKLPEMDQAMAALIADLESRGLLESTAIIWMGEFGRTPRINGNAGRDHWARSWSCVVGGAGFKGGVAVGETSADGTRVETEPYSSQDLMASVCKAVGISLETTFTSKNGRPMKIANSGKVIKELFA